MNDNIPAPPPGHNCVAHMHMHTGQCWRAGWREGYAAAMQALANELLGADK